MTKQIFKAKLLLITLVISLITSCSKDTNTIKVQPLKTTIKGELGNYISIVNDEYTITKIKDDLSANWEISFKLKTLKRGDFNTDNSAIDFKLQLVDEKGKPITGLNDFWMATGLFGTVNELNKLREFIKGKENEEDWFSLQMKVQNKDFEEKLPKNATHFIIRTIVKGKAISKNQNEFKVENEINIIIDEYENQLGILEKFIKNSTDDLLSGKLNNTEEGISWGLKLNELSLNALAVSDRLKNYKKSQFAKYQIERWEEMVKKGEEIFTLPIDNEKNTEKRARRD